MYLQSINSRLEGFILLVSIIESQTPYLGGTWGIHFSKNSGS